MGRCRGWQEKMLSPPRAVIYHCSLVSLFKRFLSSHSLWVSAYLINCVIVCQSTTIPNSSFMPCGWRDFTVAIYRFCFRFASKQPRTNQCEFRDFSWVAHSKTEYLVHAWGGWECWISVETSTYSQWYSADVVVKSGVPNQQCLQVSTNPKNWCCWSVCQVLTCKSWTGYFIRNDRRSVECEWSVYIIIVNQCGIVTQ